ncbi:DNA gyrase subunit A [Thermopetrobacter sp. TC1]|uniref:DNA gyrase subunit A n=1 Tax=Thermopetrobacter sp. TC1 TaxID=1495045 RepID=UPI00056FB144|nr:DNA gyrase subunit A [Thermopetrobacter sp. TC1]
MSEHTNSHHHGEGGGSIRPIAIEEEMRRSYLDYAMSVIVARALPDVRDGLKPVHRRILYSMYENGYRWDRPYRKSARVVGDVMGKYHPHGDAAIYDALVRMAQDFSLRLPLLDGQGNFGSVDGDPPAAMRYTEVRLGRAARYLLEDIDKDTVDFQPNYDGSEQEPTVLPARFPNLLVNGAGGIAVGMATNMAPHNLAEVIAATRAYIANPDISIDALMEHLPGPDFPTGGIILGRAGIRAAYHTGRGSVIVRGRAHIEEVRKDRLAIIVTEIPYQVNKAAMVEKIAELVKEKRIEGIADIRDESDRHGMRVVIELKREGNPDVVLNQLYRYSPLQVTFGINNVALIGGRPELLNLKQLIAAFVDFREEVVTRRTRHLLAKARDRAHVLVGLAIAVSNIDEVIRLIRAAPDPAAARKALMERDWKAEEMMPYIRLIADPRVILNEDGTFRLTEAQARAILDLRLHRLTALGRDEIAEQLEKLAAEIADYLDILRSRQRVMDIIAAELDEVAEEFADARRTEIVEAEGEIEDEDLIAREDMVVTVTHAGYIKRTPLAEYRAQRRGGKGRAGVKTREEDFVTRLFVANTHTPLVFFTSRGMAYQLKVWKLPLAAPNARGRPLINLLPLEQGETVTSVLPLPEDEAEWDKLDVMFCTRSGHVRRNRLSDFTGIKSNGKIAMKLTDGDAILAVETCTEQDDILLTTAQGQAIRFPVTAVRVFAGRNSIGVRGIKLAEGDEVISMSVLKHFELTPEERDAYFRMKKGEDDGLSPERFAEIEAAEQLILTLSEKGYGKRTSSHEYRVTDRGGSGIKAMGLSEKTGLLIAAFPVEDGDQIMLVTDKGKLIRTSVDEISIMGRAAQGVIVFRTEDDERVVSAERISETEEDEKDEGSIDDQNA